MFLIWLSSDIERIPTKVLETLKDMETELFVSTICFWELSIKQRVGKIDAAGRLDRIVRGAGFGS